MSILIPESEALVQPNSDEMAFLRDFYRRNIVTNKSTGVPQPFEVQVDGQQFDLKPTYRPLELQEDEPPPVVKPGIPPPQIDSFYPYWGDSAGGDTVDIYGKNFLPSATVRFATTDADNNFIVVHNKTHITCRSPFVYVDPNTLIHLVDISVSNVDPFNSALSDSLGTFQYEHPPNQISLGIPGGAGSLFGSVNSSPGPGLGTFPNGTTYIPLVTWINTSVSFPWTGDLYIQLYPFGASPGSGGYYFIRNGNLRLGINVSGGGSGANFQMKITPAERNAASFYWYYGT